LSRLDWITMILLLSFVVGLVLAFFLYLRTAYRKGGWQLVKMDFLVAMIALGTLYLLRAAENSDLSLLKEAVNRATR